MVDLSEVFGGDTIKAADLQGREHSVVIEGVKPKQFDNGNKLIITFQGRKKALVCNKTNANRIAYAYGTNTAGWIGKEVILYPDLVDFQGKPVEAVRVKPPLARSAPQQGRQFTDRQISGGGRIMDSEPMDGLEEVVGRNQSREDF